MWRFWAAQSDDDSGDDSGSVSGPEVKVGGGAFGGYGYESSSSSDEARRVVRSKKDKASEASNVLIGKLRNHVKIDDWKPVSTDFAELLKMCAKNKTAGDDKLSIKTICKLEDDIDGPDGAWAEKKKLHKDNQRALTRIVRQDIRKMISGDYKEKVDAYRATAQEEESDFASEDSSSSVLSKFSW